MYVTIVLTTNSCLANLSFWGEIIDVQRSGGQGAYHVRFFGHKFGGANCGFVLLPNLGEMIPIGLCKIFERVQQIATSSCSKRG